MTLYDIPLLNNKKTLLGGYGLMLGGFADLLRAIADIASLTAGLFLGNVQVLDYLTQLPDLASQATVFFMGLLGVGLGHKIVKASE